jgi:hypothetical protein
MGLVAGRGRGQDSEWCWLVKCVVCESNLGNGFVFSVLADGVKIHLADSVETFLTGRTQVSRESGRDCSELRWIKRDLPAWWPGPLWAAHARRLNSVDPGNAGAGLSSSQSWNGYGFWGIRWGWWIRAGCLRSLRRQLRHRRQIFIQLLSPGRKV